jgi:thiamine-monophosphate kinase
LTSRASDRPPRAGERELIAHIRTRLPAAASSIIVGPGDDAAVITPERGTLQVLTTDALVEGVHFDRRFSGLDDVGFKALAVSVSDVVAMGATPQYALLSLILPDNTSLADLDALLDGLLEMAALSRTSVVGGNISRSPGPLVVDVTVTGYVRPRRILTRGGGRPGDALYVTGSIGAASAGLGWLRQQFGEGAGPTTPSANATRTARHELDPGLAECVRRHRRPEPRVRAGILLGRNRSASACMDLSDGLADAVRQMAEASGTGAVIDVAAVPIDAAAARWFESRGVDPVLAAVSGGDDYELLFAVPRKSRGRFRSVQGEARQLPLTRIGELTATSDILLSSDGSTAAMPSGFTHF